ncbi:Putative esterase [Amycolatopsis camponoti]|uniref:Esterase n=1 Tax=Amycolatopsis camponoti TaxID=2606593 RepID=A0A6I8LTS9_9PSEU|nr:Putative esterase [Amycolatopsis camponoti]
MKGAVAPGFEPVRDAFASVLARTGGGAAFSVVRRGEVLAELWGGPGWTRDTLVVLFSGTKGVVATVMALLRIDPAAPVSRYWPEFPSGDVAHVLSHTIGLPYVEAEVSLLDNRANALALASQRPLWTPGSRVAYHTATYGYLCTELIRRVTGTSAGAVVRSLLGGFGIHLGTPPSEDHRVARLTRSPDYRISTFLHDPARRRIVDKMYRGLLEPDTINSAAYRRAELAAGGATGSAAAMARLYDRICAGLVPPSVLAEATSTWSSGTDAINDRPIRFGLGYELADSLGTYGPAKTAFGHSGAGGGRHGAWPEEELGFSFTTSELQPEDTDRRGSLLLEALAGCL